MFNSGLGFSVVWKSICEEKKFFQLSIWAMIFYFDHWRMLGRARLSSVSDWVQNQEITRLHKNISGSEASSLQILFNFWDFDIDPAQSWCQGWVKIANTKCSSMFDILQCIPMLDQAKQWWTAEERNASRQLRKFNPSQDTSATDSLVTLGSHGPETCSEKRSTQNNAVRQIWKAYIRCGLWKLCEGWFV